MNKNELKKVLKPLIKECIKEVLFEEKGVLSHVISEVAGGMTNQNSKPVVKERAERKWMANASAAADSSNKKSLMEKKKHLLDAIGKDAYGGVNLFEGTTPAPAPSGTGGQGPLSGVAPTDPGVDISNIFSGKSAAIFSKMMENK